MYAAADIPTAWNRAIAYGDGFFETIAVLDGIAPLWSFHYARLQQSAQRLGIHCDIVQLEKTFRAYAEEQRNAVIKITVARSGGTRGYDAREASQSTVHMQGYPLPQYSREKIQQGVRLHVCSHRLSHNPVLAGIKHLNRLEQVMAASERQTAWADEVLMLDNSGAVIECTASNIFIFRNHALETPILDNCGVAGVMRAAIMQKMTMELSLPIKESRITLQDILTAETTFICNSVFGVWPVSSIGVSQLSMNQAIIEKLWHWLSGSGYARLYV